MFQLAVDFSILVQTFFYVTIVTISHGNWSHDANIIHIYIIITAIIEGFKYVVLHNLLLVLENLIKCLN